MKKSKAQIRRQREKKKPKNIFISFVKWFFILIFLLGLMSAAGLFLLYNYLTQDLPKIDTLNDYKPPIITTVFSDDGRKIGEFFKERRIVIPLDEMPDILINAFISAEDSSFWEHSGIDLSSIFRAALKNFQAGAIVQGGSTITQQVTKTFLLTPERTYTRKLKEAILAYRIEKNFTKNEILHLYMNQIYLGHGSYGVAAAAENYFGKHVKDLNLAECAMLAALPRAPAKYSPFSFPEKAKQRQIYVVNRMKEDSLINNIEATEAINFKLDIKPKKNWFIENVPYYTEHVRRYVTEYLQTLPQYKDNKDAFYTEGFKVHTAVNIELHKFAQDAVKQGLHDLDRRLGYRGPLKNIPLSEVESFCKEVSKTISNNILEKGVQYQAVVTEVDDSKKLVMIRLGDFKGYIKFDTMSWARKPNKRLAFYEAKIRKPSQALKPGDIILSQLLNDSEKEGTSEEKESEFILDQEPIAEAALLCIEADTGYVKAMIGGRDFRISQFNRAYQSRRQPGSAFKPIIYAAALDKGYTVASIIIDSPIVYDDGTEAIWKPHNYHEKFYGPTLLKEALAHSRNIVTIKILKNIGIDYTIEYAGKLGITSKLSPTLSLALGASGISLFELVTAYSVFANQGYLIEPIFITKIEDREGEVLESFTQVRNKKIDMDTAYIMTKLLEGVIKEGTGWRIKALNRPAAGKTGTTNKLVDAWFLGYTPGYISGAWVGFDQGATLGKNETGGRAASPIWLDFMKNALKDKPIRDFTVPEGVVFAKIDAKTGLLPNSKTEKTIFECFKEGTVPTKSSPTEDTAVGSESFFKNEMQ